jgi:hypothetical protein
MAARTSKPSDISQTVAPPGSPKRGGLRASDRSPARRQWPAAAGPQGRRFPSPIDAAAEVGSPRQYKLVDLAKEWMLDLRVLGRSDRTLDWYRQKLDAYFAREGRRQDNISAEARPLDAADQ